MEVSPVLEVPEIRFVESLTDAEIDELWGMYEEVFLPLNRKSPCRQSFYEDEFRAAMARPDFYKMGVYVDGQLMSMAVWSRNLNQFPWLSRDFFEAEYPDLYASGGITYVVALLTKPEAHRRGYGSAGAKETVDEILVHGGMMVVDVCDANRDLPKVAAEHYFGLHANVEVTQLGTQTYWGLQFTPMAA
jgi:hypothetical protein